MAAALQVAQGGHTQVLQVQTPSTHVTARVRALVVVIIHDLKHACNTRIVTTVTVFINLYTGPLLMSWVTAGHMTESEVANIIDLESFLMSWVTAGHETESEAGNIIDLESFLMTWVTAGDPDETESEAVNIIVLE